MKIESTAFKDRQPIPPKYTCDGENISPPLLFLDVPPKAKSLVLIVDDPDAPGGTFDHWVVFNIDPAVIDVPERTVPKGGQEGSTSFGGDHYGGPCPPSGTHRYFFKLYALDTALSSRSEADAKELLQAMRGHIIASAELVGQYHRISQKEESEGF